MKVEVVFFVRCDDGMDLHLPVVTADVLEGLAALAPQGEGADDDEDIVRLVTPRHTLDWAHTEEQLLHDGEEAHALPAAPEAEAEGRDVEPVPLAPQRTRAESLPPLPASGRIGKLVASLRGSRVRSRQGVFGKELSF